MIAGRIATGSEFAQEMNLPSIVSMRGSFKSLSYKLVPGPESKKTRKASLLQGFRKPFGVKGTP
jgi:hypothetical protein